MKDSNITVTMVDVDDENGNPVTITVPYNYDEYDDYTINTAGLNWGNISLDNNKNVSNGIQVHGDKGTWDIEERIKIIERVLNIPERDYVMEERHPELKEMFNKHMREVERVINQLPDSSEYEQEVEKHRMWDVLTGPDRNIEGGG